MLAIDILSLLFFLWTVALFFWLIRSGIEMVWKVVAFLVYLAYGLLYSQELALALNMMQTGYVEFFMTLMVNIGLGIFNHLVHIWSVVMVVVFYMISEQDAEKAVRGLFLFTIFVWMIWLLNFFAGQTLGPIIKEELPKFFP